MQQLDIFPRQAVQFRPVKERSLCALHTLSRTTPALGETERDVWTAAAPLAGAGGMRGANAK